MDIKNRDLDLMSKTRASKLYKAMALHAIKLWAILRCSAGEKIQSTMVMYLTRKLYIDLGISPGQQRGHRPWTTTLHKLPIGGTREADR